MYQIYILDDVSLLPIVTNQMFKLLSSGCYGQLNLFFSMKALIPLFITAALLSSYIHTARKMNAKTFIIISHWDVKTLFS